MEYTLDDLKKEIIIAAQGDVRDPSENLVREILPSKLELLFGKFGIKGIAQTTKTFTPKDYITFATRLVGEYGTYDCTVVNAANFGVNAKLVFTYPNSKPDGEYCGILAVSDELKPRDFEEHSVLERIAARVSNLTWNENSNGRLKIQVPLSAQTIIAQEYQQLFGVITIFNAFKEYQQKRDDEIDRISKQIIITANVV